MSPQSLVVLLLVIVGCTAVHSNGQLAQKVAVRSSPDDESAIEESEAGSQSRTIYNHKHLSPHRMMHFGKRLLVQQAPGIYTTTNQVLDPYQRQPFEQQQQTERQEQLQTGMAFPYTLYFPMPSNRVLESVQPDSFGLAHDRQVLNIVQNLLGLTKQQQQQVQFRRQASNFAQPKLMRLMKADEQQLDSTGANNESLQTIYTAKKQSAATGGNAEAHQQQQTAEGGQLEQQDSSATSNGRLEGDEIDRASRSVGGNRPLTSGLTRAQFSMLFGGQPSPSSQATSLLNFIKKAEPQRMTFMHFGRRR